MFLSKANLKKSEELNFWINSFDSFKETKNLIGLAYVTNRIFELTKEIFYISKTILASEGFWGVHNIKNWTNFYLRRFFNFLRPAYDICIWNIQDKKTLWSNDIHNQINPFFGDLEKVYKYYQKNFRWKKKL